MAFIRIKIFYGKSYAYLVENINTEKGSRQKVKQYLGRVHELESNDSKRSLVKAESRNSFIRQLVLRELVKFKEKDGVHRFKKFAFCPNDFTIRRATKTGQDKETIFSLNNGYLSSFTLQRILSFKKSENLQKDGYILAKFFLEAGLPVSPEEFIGFYGLL